MTAFGNGTFGKGFELKTEITNGKCPLCFNKGVLVSIYDNIFRCMNCGGDIEQKVNGVISFMPIGNSMDKVKPTMTMVNEKDGS
tara:strand:+ start:147 stop:398 length:252 start_codon:yes stop_codon:yes gene_type:complete